MTYPAFDVESAPVDDPNDLMARPILDLLDDEQKILRKLRAQIQLYRRKNKVKQRYYEASQVVKHLDIAVPRGMDADIATACGWGGTVVDVLEERTDFLGWETPSGDIDGLDVIYNDNDLGVITGFGHIDALTTGVSFVSVGNEDEDAERQIISVESSSNATVFWDYRKRRSTAGLAQITNEKGQIVGEILYLENTTVSLKRDNPNDKWQVVGRDDHNQGRCFMTRLVNKARPYQIDGRSEITAAVRYYTDAAIRTMLGMEVNREFYTAPQRYILNADPADFGVDPEMSKEEKFRVGLSVAMGMINIVPGRQDNTEGDPVSVLEMKPAPPTPYIEQIKSYTVLLSAETGFPVEYFGFTTDNPPSADSIRQREYRLVKRATRRNGSFGMGMREVGLLCLLARDGEADIDFARNLRSKYADPSTPTRAATADELQKAIASGLLVPTGRTAQKRFGLSDLEIAQEDKDRQAFEAKQLRDQMRQQAMAAAQQAAQNPQGGGGQPSTTKKPPVTPTGSAT